MAERAAVFDKIIGDYLEEIDKLDDTNRMGEILGVSVEAGRFGIPLFHRRFTVSAENILDENGKAPSHASCVILLKYLLLCPDRPNHDQKLVTYKDFKDAAPYVEGFRNTAEHLIARHFEGSLENLREQCLNLEGTPFQTDVACDLAFRFQALPKVPVFLMFNDADEDFGSQSTVLFQKNATSFLDMECIAMAGGILASWLINRGIGRSSISFYPGVGMFFVAKMYFALKK